MKQKQKVPMSLDIRSGYGWELLATFSQRAKEVGWEIPDIGSVVLQALSGNYNNLIETLELFTIHTHSTIQTKQFDSLFIKRTHPTFQESHLRMIYYFLKRMEYAISQEKKVIESDWLEILSVNDLTDIIQHMTQGFARIEFENLNTSSKKQLLSLVSDHTTLLLFLIHVIEDHLLAVMYPVCTQTDIDYLLSHECGAEDDIAAKPFTHWTDEEWKRYRKYTQESDLSLRFVLLEAHIPEKKKYDCLEHLETFEMYERAWFACARRLDENPLANVRISYAWIEPNN